MNKPSEVYRCTYLEDLLVCMGFVSNSVNIGRVSGIRKLILSEPRIVRQDYLFRFVRSPSSFVFRSTSGLPSRVDLGQWLCIKNVQPYRLELFTVPRRINVFNITSAMSGDFV